MHELLTRMADDLKLAQGTHERMEDYERRLLWSALGRMAEAALHDRYDGMPEGEISVTRFRRRIEHLIEAYDALFPAIGFRAALAGQEDASLAGGADALYRLMLENGMAYHRASYVAPPRAVRQPLGGIVFIRGQMPPAEECASGFSAYQLREKWQGQPADASQAEAVRAMFQLDAPLDEGLPDCLAAHAVFSPVPEGARLMYLRTDGEFLKGYWQAHPSSEFTLGREKDAFGAMCYYLCRMPQHGRAERWKIPEWCDHGLLAHSFLLQMGTLPSTHFRRDGAIVHLRCGYQYPREEQRFLAYVSWPEPGSTGFRIATERVLSAPFFEGIRVLLTALGFSFIEDETDEKQKGELFA